MTSKYFNEIVFKVSESANKDVPDNVKTDFYKFYKQATIGDCNTPKPSFFNLRDTVKWNAWNSISGMSKEDAQLNYIELYKIHM